MPLKMPAIHPHPVLDISVYFGNYKLCVSCATSLAEVAGKWRGENTL